MKKRNIVLALLTLLGIITFLDRINISVAGPSIMDDLNLNETQFGWVLSIFILSYSLFQIPLGAWGDKRGQRSVLALIVLWWSLFTGLTGVAGSFAALFAIRFLFGIGEAGAYPNMTGVIGKWFPKAERGRAQGFIWAASRFGGALTPILVVPVIAGFGWRMAFIMLGGLGILWCVAWLAWYRDDPSRVRGIVPEELARIEPIEKKLKEKIPWKRILEKKQFWLILAMYWFYVWGSWFFFSWFPTFLVKGRGFTDNEMKWAVALPFLLGVGGNIAGGFLTDYFSKKRGVKFGRRITGVTGLVFAAIMMFLAAFVPGKFAVFIFLSLCFGIMDLMLPSAWAVCLDVGRKYAGAISGAMNTSGNLGGFVCATVFGYLVAGTGNYNVPLYVISGMLIISAFLFLQINPGKQLIEENGLT
jgi:sugar phosphate permease